MPDSGLFVAIKHDLKVGRGGFLNSHNPNITYIFIVTYSDYATNHIAPQILTATQILLIRFFPFSACRMACSLFTSIV
ncbi:hypothetical protein EGN72_00820 [Pseudorhodobacter sp. E13]|nr:hypothetical protein EGN72_00820 [Pseudorhodobacter sp. E13]